MALTDIDFTAGDAIVQVQARGNIGVPTDVAAPATDEQEMQIPTPETVSVF